MIYFALYLNRYFMCTEKYYQCSLLSYYFRNFFICIFSTVLFDSCLFYWPSNKNAACLIVALFTFTGFMLKGFFRKCFCFILQTKSYESFLNDFVLNCLHEHVWLFLQNLYKTKLMLINIISLNLVSCKTTLNIASLRFITFEQKAVKVKYVDARTNFRWCRWWLRTK